MISSNRAVLFGTAAAALLAFTFSTTSSARADTEIAGHLQVSNPDRRAPVSITTPEGSAVVFDLPARRAAGRHDDCVDRQNDDRQIHQVEKVFPKSAAGGRSACLALVAGPRATRLDGRRRGRLGSTSRHRGPSRATPSSPWFTSAARLALDRCRCGRRRRSRGDRSPRPGRRSAESVTDETRALSTRQRALRGTFTQNMVRFASPDCTSMLP